MNTAVSSILDEDSDEKGDQIGQSSDCPLNLRPDIPVDWGTQVSGGHWKLYCGLASFYSSVLPCWRSPQRQATAVPTTRRALLAPTLCPVTVGGAPPLALAAPVLLLVNEISVDVEVSFLLT